MSIKIRKLTGEILDLPPDFVIEGEKNNPLFNDKGSQTVSISFPPTDNNRKQLGFPYRLDKMSTPENMRVAVESGVMQQTGIMAINAASNKIIQASIGFDEGEMYNQMNSLLLRDLSNLPVREPQFPANTLEGNVHLMMNLLNTVMQGTVDNDLVVFPVILKTGRDPESMQVYNIC
jgi:hypothetical protein